MGNVNGLSLDLLVHPGETIKEVLEEKKMSQEELAIRTEYSPKHISEVVRGKKDISSEFANRLEYALGIPASFWMNLQSNYDKEVFEINSLSNIEEKELNILKDLKDVIMVKIISNKKLLKGEKQKLNISLSSSESRASSIEKLGSINIWNPLSILNTTSISGEFKGNKVATKLLFPELSGRIFLDNNLNGIYDEDIDKIVSASKIELYKLKDDNLYELISLDGDILIDNKTGQYYINDSKYLNEGIYALKFTLPDEYNILENNVIDKSGWIKNIKVNGMPINNLNVPLLKYDLDISKKIIYQVESIAVDEDQKALVGKMLEEYSKNGLISMIIVSILITFFFSTLLDVLTLSLFGIITCFISKIKINYKALFNMSIFAMTLSIILKLLYFALLLLANFEIKYFDVVYAAVSYISLTAAIFMIKSDIIKQNLELMKIIEDSKQKIEETITIPKRPKDKEENKEEKEENKEDKKEKEGTEEQGSNA